MAMNTYATVHSSSLTQTMEIMTDTFPLDLYLQKEATCAFCEITELINVTVGGHQ